MTKKYILSSTNIILFIYLSIILLLGFSIIGLYKLPIIIILSIFVVISAAIIILLYFSKKTFYYNIGVIITIILNIITLTSIYTLNSEYKYIENIINKEYIYDTYSVYVLKKNPTYSSIKKLSGKKIGLLTNEDNISSHLNSKINIKCIKYKTIEELETALINGEIQCIILSENEKNLLDKYTNLKKSTRVIYENKIIDTI